LAKIDWKEARKEKTVILVIIKYYPISIILVRNIKYYTISGDIGQDYLRQYYTISIILVSIVKYCLILHKMYVPCDLIVF